MGALFVAPSRPASSVVAHMAVLGTTNAVMRVTQSMIILGLMASWPAKAKSLPPPPQQLERRPPHVLFVASSAPASPVVAHVAVLGTINAGMRVTQSMSIL